MLYERIRTYMGLPPQPHCHCRFIPLLSTLMGIKSSDGSFVDALLMNLRHSKGVDKGGGGGGGQGGFSPPDF